MKDIINKANNFFYLIIIYYNYYINVIEREKNKINKIKIFNKEIMIF